ncbi:MAG: GerMN domain-containing protein [Firmicutes bacterium]|nr:GerMN domain-containing protein [Bacillota bacterium]
MKTNKKIAVALSVIFALIAFISVLAAFNDKKPTDESSINMGADIYYVQNIGSTLVSEKCEIDGVSMHDMAMSAIEKMQSRPKSESLVSAVPPNVEVLDVKIYNKKIIVDFSEEYLELKAGEEMICRSAMVWTLTGLYFVDGVSFTVEGKPVVKVNGDALGVMTRDNLIINAEIDPEPTNSTRSITIYFADATAQTLVKEEIRVNVNINENLEKYIMEALIAGPSGEGKLRTVPAETKIRDIKSADGICYVDLSEDFVTKHGGGETAEMLTVYSIVNSLTRLSSIEKVQFLIEGEKRSQFKGGLEFDKPFEAKEFD